MRVIIKSFFYSREKFQPIYFWATFLLACICVAFVEKLYGVDYISDNLLLGLFAFVNLLIGMYSLYRYGADKKSDQGKG